MVLVTLFPVIALYLFCFLSNLLVALPTSRFAHTLQTLPARSLPEDSNPARNIDPSQPHRLRKRGLPGAVYICTEENFRGDCAWTSPNNRCHIAGTGNFSARSIGPDENGFCILFEKATCTGNQITTLRFPGLATNMPAFMSLKCYADQPKTANETGIVNDGSRVGSGILPGATFEKGDADPRLSGGVGSAERKKLEKQMKQMEKDGFKHGMIGLLKGHYY